VAEGHDHPRQQQHQSYEVEDVLRRSPLVQDVCVVGYPDEDLGERSCAFVAPAAGHEPTLEELGAHLEDVGLARYKWPERLHLVDELPVGSTGKLDRKRLRKEASQR
jgi:non-ribosomal peptide synthetase component E (peptide arylation enzyme)